IDGRHGHPPFSDLLDVSALFSSLSTHLRIFSVLSPVLSAFDILQGDVIGLSPFDGLPLPTVPSIVAVAAREDQDDVLLLRHFAASGLLTTQSFQMAEPVLQLSDEVRIVAAEP